MSGSADNKAGDWVGVALSRTEIVAYDSRLKHAGGPAWRMPLEAPTPDSPVWPSLAVALRTLAQLTREPRGHLAIALLPSVAEVRLVEAPPLSDDELEMVLSRNAGKYFVGAQGAQLVGVAAGARAQPTGVIAASAPAWIIRLISVAAREAGWTLEHIAPAEAAWCEAVAQAWPSTSKENALLLVHQTDHTHAVTVKQGALTGVRRFRSAVADVPVFVEALVPSTRLLALGDGDVRKQWSTTLATRALTVTPPLNMSAEVAGDAALSAAAYVTDADSLVFRTEEMRAADRKRRSQTMFSLIGVAALFLVAAAGFVRWDVERELAAVQAARAALKPQLATTVLGRTTVETVSGQLEMLATTEREGAQWSGVIADLTKHLPSDAYLTAFRGWSDSVRFDGLAERAAAVFPPLSRAESFSGIKAAAAVRLEAQVDGTTREKFTLVAKLRPRNVLPSKVATDTGATARSTERGAP